MLGRTNCTFYRDKIVLKKKLGRKIDYRHTHNIFVCFFEDITRIMPNIG